MNTTLLYQQIENILLQESDGNADSDGDGDGDDYNNNGKNNDNNDKKKKSIKIKCFFRLETLYLLPFVDISTDSNKMQKNQVILIFFLNVTFYMLRVTCHLSFVLSPF